MEIQGLADLILIQSREVLRAKGYDSQTAGYRVEVITGPKYTRIDRGYYSKLPVDRKNRQEK